MLISTETRAARKKVQIARLAQKNSPNYAILYANQPVQLKRHAELEAERSSKRDASAALEAQSLSDLQDGALVFESVGAISTPSEDRKPE